MSAETYCTQAGIPMTSMPGGAKFNSRYKERFKTNVQLYAPYSYDATMAFIEAMKAANSVEPSKYLPALQKLNVPGISGEIAFDKNGDIREGGVTMYRFSGGKWEALN